MAEVFVVGPLLNFGFFLGTWLWKKYQQSDINREHNREVGHLVAAVQNLETFVSSKGEQLREFQLTLGIRSDSFGILTSDLTLIIVTLNREIDYAHRHARYTLDSRGLKAETKRARIEGIHNRLTQSLVLHLGVMIMEV